MAISVEWGAKVINVPQADLTPLGGSVWELDVDAFRLTLKGLEDDEAGIAFPRTHNHNPTVTLGGVTIARTVEITNGYTITFEDGQYAVKLTGANNNIPDVTNVNQVSIRSNNSAGLIVAGSGVTAQDRADIATEVWASKESVDIASIAGDAGAPTRLAYSAMSMPIGTVDTSAFTPTSTAFETDLALPYTDHIKGRSLLWRSGDLELHACRIAGYEPVGGRGRITVSGLPTTPTHGDTFVVV